MSERVIFHVDVNSAFLSWESVYRLKYLGAGTDLRLISSAVTGNVKLRQGIVLAKSIPAGKCGIKTGESVTDALKKCPSLVLVPPHYHLYEQCSMAFMDILRSFSPCVEPYSIDEAFCDMTGTEGLHGGPVTTAELMKDTIYRELGFTVNIGISSNKLLAKMASDFKKPNLVHTLFPEEIPEKLWPLPISDLLFVGRATAKKLIDLGICTVGDAANADVGLLKAHLKKQGEIVWAFANGLDFSAVTETAPAPKGYGNSMTVPFDVEKKEMAFLVLLSLCEKVGTRLRKDGVVAGVISVQLTYYDFTRESHQMTLLSPTNVTEELNESVQKLFLQLWNGKRIRQIGVHTSRVSGESGFFQHNLFEVNSHDKLLEWNQTMDRIRERYGKDAVMRGSFLDAPIYHMSGGIGREKQEVDYKEVDLS